MVSTQFFFVYLWTTFLRKNCKRNTAAETFTNASIAMVTNVSRPGNAVVFRQWCLSSLDATVKPRCEFNGIKNETKNRRRRGRTGGRLRTSTIKKMYLLNRDTSIQCRRLNYLMLIPARRHQLFASSYGGKMGSGVILILTSGERGLEEFYL